MPSLDWNCSQLNSISTYCSMEPESSMPLRVCLTETSTMSGRWTHTYIIRYVLWLLYCIFLYCIFLLCTSSNFNQFLIFTIVFTIQHISIPYFVLPCCHIFRTYILYVLLRIVLLQACMNQKHLLRFIKHKLRYVPHEVVTYRDGKYLTLGEVFESLKLTGRVGNMITLDYTALHYTTLLYTYFAFHNFCPLLSSHLLFFSSILSMFLSLCSVWFVDRHFGHARTRHLPSIR